MGTLLLWVSLLSLWQARSNKAYPSRSLHPTPCRLLLLLRSRPEGLHEVEQEFCLPGNVRIGVGEFPDPAGGVEHGPHAVGRGLEPLVIDGQTECFQEVFGRFETVDIGESLLEGGEDIRVEVEGLGVFFDEAGGVVGHGLIAGQGFVEGLDVAGVQRRLVLDVEQLGDLFEIGLLGGGIGVFRHGVSPGREFVGEMMDKG